MLNDEGKAIIIARIESDLVRMLIAMRYLEIAYHHRLCHLIGLLRSFVVCEPIWALFVF